jgi:hypothetical protein
LTCPRCLAEIPGSEAHVQAGEPPTAPGSSPAELAGIPLCPSCGKVVEKAWVACPFCTAPLAEPAAREIPAALERDVRRDTLETILGLAVIGVLSAIGLGIIGGLGLPIFLGIVLIVVVLSLLPRNPSARGIERVVAPVRRPPGETPTTKRSLWETITLILGVVVVIYLVSAVAFALALSSFLSTTCKWR